MSKSTELLVASADRELRRPGPTGAGAASSGRPSTPTAGRAGGLRAPRGPLLRALLAGSALCALYVLLQTRWLLGESHGSAGPGGGGASRRSCAVPAEAPVEGMLLDSPRCRIPARRPLSEEVRRFVFEQPPYVCDDPPPLVRSNDSHLWLERGLAARYLDGPLRCCYSGMRRAKGPDWRADPKLLEDDVEHASDIRFDSTCTPLDGPVPAPHEFVRVQCRADNGTLVHTDVHAFVPVREAGAEVVAEVVAEGPSLSVLVLGIDSVSRLNFVRKMARTRAFLEGRLGARPFLAFNKVEDNTFPNLVPLLSGLSVPELRAACWPKEQSHFDACPWVWARFKARGYATMFAEDTAWMGLFHYLKRGFANQPTDFDPRPVLYWGEKALGRGGGFNAQYCIGQRHQTEVLLGYGLKFVRAMEARRQKFFGMLWGSALSHDALNDPEVADAMYADFLAELEASGALNRTALVFMSDHGLRFGGVLGTAQGRLEGLLPALYVLLPAWARARHPLAARHLECNRGSLVTVFDLHRTFDDLMDADRGALEDARVLEEARRVAAAAARGAPPRGASLFAPVPERDCAAAGIPDNYCACQRLADASTSDPGVLDAAAFVVEHINGLLSGHADCERLELSAVVAAQRGPAEAEEGPSEVRVTLRTEPGGALIEATVRHAADGPALELAGSVNRLNAYGSSSACVNSTALRKLCHCRQQNASAAA